MNLDQAELTIDRVLVFQKELCDLLEKVYSEAGLMSTTQDKIKSLRERIQKTRDLIAKYPV